MLANMRVVAQDESLTIFDIEAFRHIWDAGRESVQGRTTH